MQKVNDDRIFFFFISSCRAPKNDENQFFLYFKYFRVAIRNDFEQKVWTSFFK